MTAYLIHEQKREDQGIAGVYIPEKLFVGHGAESITGVTVRSVIRLRAAAKPVYCQALPLDQYYLRGFTASDKDPIEPDSTIVMGAYYRGRLNVDLGSRPEIDITSKDTHIGRLRAGLEHPEVTVRTAAFLGAVGLFLAVVGLVVGIIALIITLK